MSAHAQSPMVRQLSDPDGMGVTPTHQVETEDLDTKLWTAEEGGEHTLPVPFRLPGQATGGDDGGMLRVARRTVQESRREAKRTHRSLGSTAPPSTPSARGPWCYDSDTFHFFSSCDSFTLHVPSPMTHSGLTNHDSLLTGTFHMTSLPTSL